MNCRKALLTSQEIAAGLQYNRILCFSELLHRHREVRTLPLPSSHRVTLKEPRCTSRQVFSLTYFLLKMFVVSIGLWIIAGFLKAFLVDGNSLIKQYLYSRVANGEGQPLCSVNDPSATIYGVLRPLSCLLEHCVPTESCVSANYYTDTGKCELFHYHPTDFFRIAGDCVHYKVLM